MRDNTKKEKALVVVTTAYDDDRSHNLWCDVSCVGFDSMSEDGTLLVCRLFTEDDTDDLSGSTKLEWENPWGPRRCDKCIAATEKADEKRV